jgi:diadenosine tetraphosphate (Ap4A) HIT family hydrolase
VPHAHLHLVPVDGANDIDFRRATPAEGDELQAMADKLRGVLGD